MAHTRTWTVPIEDVEIRLDHFLVERLSPLSRSAIQKLIKTNQIMVNKKAATVHRFLKKGDKVSLETKETFSARKEKETTKSSAVVTSSNTKASLKIIEETADWMVLDKPAGLLVHPDTKTEHGTLIDLLLAHAPSIVKAGEKPEAPGIVHRLDREVSGLMVIAKTQHAYEDLQKQFAKRVVEKHYLALVHGELPKDEDDIKFKIARSTSQPRMAARPKEKSEGRAAWTHYVVQKRFHGATLVELQIFSGRTHQIRAHLFALGCPVMGDPLYALRRTMRNVTTERLMLQSVALAFNDPHTGERKQFTLSPDPAFKRLQNTLA